MCYNRDQIQNIYIHENKAWIEEIIKYINSGYNIKYYLYFSYINTFYQTCIHKN
jgi:hypothetical protein